MKENLKFVVETILQFLSSELFISLLIEAILLFIFTVLFNVYLINKLEKDKEKKSSLFLTFKELEILYFDMYAKCSELEDILLNYFDNQHSMNLPAGAAWTTNENWLEKMYRVKVDFNILSIRSELLYSELKQYGCLDTSLKETSDEILNSFINAIDLSLSTWLPLEKINHSKESNNVYHIASKNESSESHFSDIISNIPAVGKSFNTLFKCIQNEKSKFL